MCTESPPSIYKVSVVLYVAIFYIGLFQLHSWAKFIGITVAVGKNIIIST